MGTPLDSGCRGTTEWDSRALPGGNARSCVAYMDGGRLFNTEMHHSQAGGSALYVCMWRTEPCSRVKQLALVPLPCLVGPVCDAWG